MRYTTLRSFQLYVFCLMLAALQPLSVLAEAQTPPAAEQPAVVQSQPVTTEPTPPTVTQPVATPAPAPTEPPKTYSYDSTSGRWNSNEWTYDPAANQYTPTLAPTPTPAVAPTPSIVEPTPVSQTGPPSSSEVSTNNHVANALESLATTGSASVDKNTFGGDATTGDAKATATIINNLESSMTNANNKDAATFVSDVMGDVNGDILLQPMLLKAMLEANAAKELSNQTASSSVTNDITLGAKSGNASVAGNTTAGNATTGSAHTVVDVVNLVNSMVAANQSFIGTVNIYGNLNGDILVAPDFIPQLLASNEGGAASSSTVVNASDTKRIVNNVSLAAESGSALISNNTKAGSATTGDADTNLVIFNLSGHDIIASNSLLVFVNVMGKWVGVIVDAPVGATAAAIGNGVTSHSSQSPSLTLTSSNETVLTNNIALASKSGDAFVTGNTIAGSATSGNATASANIANIANTNIGLSGWFGILFINVYGNWTGSFGIDTLAGDSNKTMVIPDEPSKQRTAYSDSKQVIEFRPSSAAYSPTSLRVIDTRPAATASTAIKTNSDTSAAKAVGIIVSDMPSSSASQSSRAKAYVQTPLLMVSLAVVGGSVYVLRRQLF